jgi:hypothetical protein
MMLLNEPMSNDLGSSAHARGRSTQPMEDSVGYEDEVVRWASLPHNRL